MLQAGYNSHSFETRALLVETFEKQQYCSLHDVITFFGENIHSRNPVV